MGFYQTENLARFRVNNPTNLIQSKLQLINSTISSPLSVAIYNSGAGVTYSASDLLNGYIIRKGHTGDITDQFDTASNIIQQLRTRYTSITNLGLTSSTGALPLGTSFECKLYNEVPAENINTREIAYYSSPDLTVRVGGPTNQITGGATAILEIVVQDQAALGADHKDQVFVCISRCAASISIFD